MQLIRQGATAGRVELTGRPRDGAGRGRGRPQRDASRSAPASTAPCSAPPSSSAASSPRSSSPPTASSSSRAALPPGAPTSTARSARLYPARAHVSIDYGAAVGPAERRPAPRRAGRLRAGRARARGRHRSPDLGVDARRGPPRRDRAAAARASRSARASSASTTSRSATTPQPPTITQLEERLARDIERGTTGVGPHLDEIGIKSGDRDLRTFGSQGEQRLAVLALLLAEAELIGERRRVAPLAPPRRRALRARREPPPHAE